MLSDMTRRAFLLGTAALGLLGALPAAALSVSEARALVDRLVAEGLIARHASPKDRRVQIVKLTAAGRRTFRTMARANGDWISDIFAELDANDIEALMHLLAKTKASASKAIAAGEPNGRR